MADSVIQRTQKSKYELVNVASREARRLNEFYRRNMLTPTKRVTTEAIERVQGSQVKYKFASEEEAPI